MVGSERGRCGPDLRLLLRRPLLRRHPGRHLGCDHSTCLRIKPLGHGVQHQVLTLFRTTTGSSPLRNGLPPLRREVDRRGTLPGDRPVGLPSQRVWASRSARKQCRDLEHEEGQPVTPGVRRLPSRVTHPSMRCGRSRTPTCLARLPCIGGAADSVRILRCPDCERMKRRRLAKDECGSGFPLPLALRPCLPGIQSGAERDHAGHDG